MKMRIVLLISVLVLILTACGTFKTHIRETGMDKSFEVQKMAVDEPGVQQNVYFARALFVAIENGNTSTPVQGVKVMWHYADGDYVTTFPLNKVKWIPDQSMEVPQFKVDWDHSYMSGITLNWEYEFPPDGTFNPNNIFQDPDFYSQIKISLNQADYDLVMSYIFK